jgi:hypothetical protein
MKKIKEILFVQKKKPAVSVGSTFLSRNQKFRIGILDAAIKIALLAIFSVTPPISYSIRPGLTTTTQYSGDPFPEPIRVSAGLTVTGLSGNIRTHIFPPRRAFRVIARRPASICLDVIQAGSSA